ncbi:regulation of enolase protein 1-like isoform X1 [Ostrinia furnacalis]|uniref:regulation of enolase protein 1-like isoform X1 n=2 Tax=Ostrinia TaxID=29056 RepID=UPI00103A6CB0|nr:regulation of enolase protein 1-like isoform X1 [Ostrinia furnacalis]
MFYLFNYFRLVFIYLILLSFNILAHTMERADFDNVTLKDFQWLNEPKHWHLDKETLEATTDNRTDFWQGTWYNFHVNTGHVFGVRLKDDFEFTVRVEADFTTLYDQAGLMIYSDEKHWLKAGIEYNDGQPMIGSVMTNVLSDWATGVYPGNPRKFWLRLTRTKGVVCVKYSIDNITWILLRLSPFEAETVLVGPMCCSPQREGLVVKFSDIKIGKPADDILHSN